MSDGEVDIRLLALKRQQRRSQNRTSAGANQIFENSQVRSGRSYEFAPIKVYNGEERSANPHRTSYLSNMPVPMFDEDTRIGRMHVPPVIRCECNDIEAYALISSSETVSTISMELVRKMRLFDQIIPDVSHVYNPLAFHHPDLKGKVKYIDFTIGSWQQVAQFNIVENSTCDVILGIDFLRKTQSILNFEECVLMVGGNKGERIPFLNTREIMTISRRSVSRQNFSHVNID